MKKSILLYLTILYAFGISAQTIIFPYGDTWKYLDNGSDQGTAWRAASFDDAGWNEGPGKLGYGIADVRTVVGYGPDSRNKYITTYFRKTFQMADPSAYTYYNAFVHRDDGIVVYVNGNEVYRNNMPAGVITYDSLASDSPPDDGAGEQAFSIPASLFVAGSNVIAVEIHQQKINSSDIAFDLQLTTPDLTPPAVLSINRQVPESASTANTSVTYRVIFSEPVAGVSRADFLVTKTGTATGTLSSTAVKHVDAEDMIYDITVSSITGEGSLGLDLKAASTGIEDLVGNPISTGFTTGETYQIDHAAPSVISLTRQSPLPISTAAATVTYRIGFSEPVMAVDFSDFQLTALSGNISGSLSEGAVTPSGPDHAFYDITISNLNGAGTLRLDLKSTSDISDSAGNVLNGGYTSGETYQVDRISPVLVSISRQSPLDEITAETVLTYRVVFSEPVFALDDQDFTLTATGTAAGVVEAQVIPAGTDNTIFDVSVHSVTGTGTLRLDLKDNNTGITDTLGNGIQGGSTAGESYSVHPADQTNPEVMSINRLTNLQSLTSTTALTFRVVFTEPVQGVDPADFTLTTVSGTATGILSGQAVVPADADHTMYDVTASDLSGAGDLRLDVNSNGTAITDTAGNVLNNGFTSGETYRIDYEPATVTGIIRESPVTESTTTATVTFRVNFSEPVTGVDARDFNLVTTASVTGLLADDAVSPAGSDGTSFDVVVSGLTGSGTLVLELKSNSGVTDTIGNVLLAGYTGGESYQVQDIIRPVVTGISRFSPETTVTTSGTVTFRVHFSEAVTGVDAADFLLVTGGSLTGNLAPDAVSYAESDGSSYDVTVSNLSGTGSLGLQLNSTADIADLSGNQLDGTFTEGETYQVDRILPEVLSISRQNPSTETSSSVTNTFRIRFSEPVKGLDNSDLSVFTSGSVQGILPPDAIVAADPEGSMYEVTLTASGTGSLRLDINDQAVISDTAGNSLQGGYTSGETYQITDEQAPVVTSIQRLVPSTPSTRDAAVTFRIHFSEPVTGVDETDLSLNFTGSAAATLDAGAVRAADSSGSSYDVVVNNISGDGSLGLDLNGSGTGIADLVGNTLAQGFSGGETYTIDHTAPAISNIQRFTPVDEVNVEPAELVFRVVFSEPVQNVQATDFMVENLGGTARGSADEVHALDETDTVFLVTVRQITGSGVLGLDPGNTPGITDLAGNALTPAYEGGETYTIDEIPKLVSLSRQFPLTQSTAVSSVTFRILFSEPVSGVDAADFSLVTSGTVNGILETGAVTPVDADGLTYDVTVSSLNGAGTLRIVLNNTGTGIEDATGNTLAQSEVTSVSYDIDREAPSVTSITRQSPNTDSTHADALIFHVLFSEPVSGLQTSDLVLTTVDGTAQGSLAADAINPVGTGYNEFEVRIGSLTGFGQLRLDVISSGGVTDTLGNVLGQAYNAGETFYIDRDAPVATSINRQWPMEQVTAARDLSFRIVFSEPVTGLDAGDFSLAYLNGTVTGTIKADALTPAGDLANTYDLKVSDIAGEGDIRLDLKDSGTGITDILGNDISGGFTSGQSYSIDLPPGVSTINRQSPLAETTAATTLTYRVTFSEPVRGVDPDDFTLAQSGTASGVLASDAVVPVSGTDSTAYDVTVGSVTGIGTLRLDLNATGTGIMDRRGIDITEGFSSGQSYIVDQAPYVVSINRQLPLSNVTSAAEVTFRVTFSKKVTGVGANDFMVKTSSGNARGSLADNVTMETVGTTPTPVITALGTAGTTYDVTLKAISGSGTIRLDLKSSGTNIIDAAGNPISGGFTGGQNYTIQQVAGEGFVSFTENNPVSVSAHTGEKPQAKCWKYDGKWWCVLASSSGTKLYRLDGTTWTPALSLATQTNPKPDCIVVGNVVHILLFRGDSDKSYLYSIEYDAATGAYKLWSKRPSKVTIPFGSGAETATIAMDGNGRMWIAGDGDTDVSIRWSDSPYTSWSAAITLATGITTDDICAVVAMPGKIGVLWSNQNTRRFGFRTHINGTDPALWTGDENPASQSAQDLGLGFADDHMNVMCASDGTLYCAVKTSYEIPGKPKLCLLVRRPAGTWDDAYPVTANEGTRGVVLLNEAAGKVRIVYTSHEVDGDILYRESSLSNISFSRPYTLFGGDLSYEYNFSTSTHQTYSTDIVIMATRDKPTPKKMVSILATDVSGTSTRSMATRENKKDTAVHTGTEGMEIIAYPNPFSRNTLISFQVPPDEEYTLTLVNGAGINLGAIERGRGKTGLQQFFLDGSSLAKGIYFVRLQTRNESRTIKLVRVE